MGMYEYEGTISSKVSFEYFPYFVRDIFQNTIDVVEEVYPAYEFWVLLREMSYLDVSEDVLFRPFQTLSHGERTKILLAINRNNIEVQKGNLSSWYENKQKQDQFELAENEKLQKEIRHLKETVKRTASWAEKSENSKIGYDPVKQENWNGRRAYIGEKTRKMQARRRHCLLQVFVKKHIYIYGMNR